MARMARVVIPNYPHHITQRGNRRQKTFFRGDDYQAYISLLSNAKEQAGIDVWAYCLMPNHVHLVVVPEHKDSLAVFFREAHRHAGEHRHFFEQRADILHRLIGLGGLVGHDVDAIDIEVRDGERVVGGNGLLDRIRLHQDAELFVDVIGSEG